MHEYLTDVRFLSRYWSRVRRDVECWEWQGAKTKAGYGQIGYGSRLVLYTHRVAYELMHGPVPVGRSVLHRCDNPPCCRPDHLYAGTQAENVADAARQGHMRRNISRDRLRAMSDKARVSNPGRKPRLTPAQVHVVHQRLNDGVRQATIAQEFGVGQATISNISKGKVKYARKRDKSCISAW